MRVSSEFLGRNLGVFLNGQGGFGDRETTSREIGFEFYTAGVTLGADYRFTDQLIVGAAVGYISANGEFAAPGGDFTMRRVTLSVFGTYYLADKFYVDAIFTCGWDDYKTTRKVSGADLSARGDTDGTQLALSASGGYNFKIAGLSLGPYVRATYIDAFVDNFRERGADTFNIDVGSQKVKSFTTDLGGQAYYAISMPWGVLTPSISAEWEHEYEGGSRLLTGRAVIDPGLVFSARTDDPDRDYFNLGVGLVATFKGGWAAFVHYETVVVRANIADHRFTAGIRLEF